MTRIFHVATRLTMMRPHCYHHPMTCPTSSLAALLLLHSITALPLLVVPRTHQAHFQLCPFVLAFPSPSNVLPLATCMSSPFTYFKSLLKSHFLRERRQSKMSSPRPEIFCIFLPFFYHVSTHLLTCYLMYLFSNSSTKIRGQ